jgi:hypothetical protein
MPLASIALLATIFFGLPIALARIVASSEHALVAWPECYFVTGERDERARLPRFAAGCPWSITIVAAPLVMIAFMWAIASVFAGKELIGAWLHGELAAPLLLALALTALRALAATMASLGAFGRNGRGVLGGLTLGALLDVAVLAIPVQVSSNRREDAMVALLSLGFTLSVAIVYAIEDARRRDRAA